MATLPASSTAPAVAGPRSIRQAAILGIGTFVPDAILTNADLEALVETSDTWILERTGIRERHRAGSGVTTSVMGTEAARRALAAAGTPKIDAIIVATSSPDTFWPSSSCLIQRRLGLPGIPAFDVNAACSGFVYAMILARSLISSGSATKVLIVAAEAMTTLVDYSDRATCVLFGDGAGACVLGAVAEGGVQAVHWGADGRDADLIYYGVKSTDLESGDAVRMHGKGTFRLAVERMTDSVERLCASAGWQPAEVDLLVPHQANLRIIEACAKRLGLPMSRAMVNVDRYGNTSAASILLALAEADATGRLHDGDRVICVAFGSGTTWGGFAMQWTAPRAE